MLKKRFIRPFRQLRGKLTLSYTLTAAVTVLLIEIIFITIVFLIISLNIPLFILSSLKQEAPQAVPFFVHGEPDHEALTAWLRIINATSTNQGPLNGHTMFLAVVDTHGQTIASIGLHPVPAGAPIAAQLSAQNQARLQAVLNDVKGKTDAVDQEADNTMVAIAPIVGEQGNIQGALVLKFIQPNLAQFISGFFSLVLASAIVVTTIAAITGIISGYLIARGLTRRLKELSTAADRWSRGNFSMPTHDDSEDELGQTMRQLNRMAEQLQNLLQTRQKLASLEERNRLARDLHDSVKQQVFAIGMQLGATKVLLKRDANAAEARLNEAEKLVRQAQQELTSLIRELRPVALEGKGLDAALRELATQWAGQTDIVANVRIEHIQPLSLAVEEALYRVTQEALANVARHSNATLVQIVLTTAEGKEGQALVAPRFIVGAAPTGEDTVTLSISDNGQGFDATRPEYRMGVGLFSMQERLKVLGGEVQIESTPGKGTRIIACCKRLGVDTSSPMAVSRSEVT